MELFLKTWLELAIVKLIRLLEVVKVKLDEFLKPELEVCWLFKKRLLELSRLKLIKSLEVCWLFKKRLLELSRLKLIKSLEFDMDKSIRLFEVVNRFI